MLQLQQLSKSFALERRQRKALANNPRLVSGRLQALAPLDLRLAPGRVLALVGPNGAGKTTLLRLVAGIMAADSGQVLVDGQPLAPTQLALRRQIGLLTGSAGLYSRLTVRENLSFFGAAYGVAKGEVGQRISQLCDELRMADFIDRRVAGLSTGMRQRAAIARAQIHHPRLLLLDEPTTGLDILSVELVVEQMARLKAAGATLLFATHHSDEVDLLCDEALVLVDGRASHFADLAALRRHYQGQTTREALLNCLREVA